MRVTAESIGFAAGDRSLVSDFSFEFHSGSLTAIIGPNGAGKTTLISLLAGDHTSSSGSVRYADESLDTVSIKRRAKLRAVLLHSQRSDTPFTVEQVVSMGRYADRGSTDDSNAQKRPWVDDAMKSLDIHDIRNMPVRLLSGGEQQRVAIARVIAQRTPVVLLDEPTTALDLGHQEAVLTLLRHLASLGHTVIAVLHDLNLVAHFDQVILLNQGRTATSGTPENVLTSEVLSAVYDHPVDVVRHPLRPGVLIVPRRSDPSDL